MTNYFEKELYINPSLADADGLLSRYETFNIFMDVADDHAGKMGVPLLADGQDEDRL